MEEVKIKDKLILAFYLNVGGLSEQDVDGYISRVRGSMKEDDSAIYYFIPVRNQETRVECVYPIFVDNQEIKERSKQVLDKLFNKINNE